MFNFLKKLWHNKKAVGGAGFAGIVISLAIGLYVAAAVLPSAIVDITNSTKWSGAPTAVITLLPIIGIVGVVALILLILRKVRG